MQQDKVFAGKTIACFTLGESLSHPAHAATGLCVGYGCCAETHQDQDFATVFNAMLADPLSAQIDTLVIGSWGNEYQQSADEVVALLVAQHAALPQLQHLFIGNISQEENEISWIEQGNLSPLYDTYPQLRTLKIRGGNRLTFGSLQLAHLQTLIVETGGLDNAVLTEIAAASLPELTHLELWLGDEGYGNNCTETDVQALLDALAAGNFPKLQRLGLRNSDNADAVAAVVAASPAVQQLRVLDLSLGALTDVGAQALLESPNLQSLQSLDLHYHYLSDAMMAQLQTLPLAVDVSEQQEPDDWGDDELYRPVFVSE
ncbi:MAG: hypothetical protein RI964_3282 [Pseudomonadota bacterium]|jgi:hypothetical protein